MEKKEVLEDRLEVLRKVVLKKLSSLKKKKFEGNLIDDFGLAFRIFILRYLNLNYEFTEEELSAELDKRKVNSVLKERILGIVNLLTEISYEGKKITKKEFHELLEEGTRLINLATPSGEKSLEEQPAVEKEKSSSFDLLIQKILRRGEPKEERKLAQAAKAEVLKKAESPKEAGAILKEKEKIVEERLKRELEKKELEKKVLDERERIKANLVKDKKELLRKLKQEIRKRLVLIKRQRQAELKRLKLEETIRKEEEKVRRKQKLREHKELLKKLKKSRKPDTFSHYSLQINLGKSEKSKESQKGK